MSDSVQPHRRQPTRLHCPWDSPGKNTGVGCHFLLQCMKVKSESEAAQSCPTLSDPMDCSLSGFSIHGIFQARVLEWGVIAFSLNILVELICGWSHDSMRFSLHPQICISCQIPVYLCAWDPRSSRWVFFVLMVLSFLKSSDIVVAVVLHHV